MKVVLGTCFGEAEGWVEDPQDLQAEDLGKCGGLQVDPGLAIAKVHHAEQEGLTQVELEAEEKAAEPSGSLGWAEAPELNLD